MKTTTPANFWSAHRGLVWSNPAADDATHIRAALLQPRFGQLLDIALAFGIARLRNEWAALRDEGTPESRRARQPVERILRHIEEGFARAAA